MTTQTDALHILICYGLCFFAGLIALLVLAFRIDTRERFGASWGLIEWVLLVLSLLCPISWLFGAIIAVVWIAVKIAKLIEWIEAKLGR